MKVISLFDGISTGQYCLNQLGIDVETYYASEIDKYAIAITQHNFPNTIQMGDVNNWKDWDIDWSSIDLIIGGSPCQNLSNAGNGTGLEGSESGLFYRYLEILNHIKSLNPNVKFLLENVVMKKEWEQVFNDLMGVKPILIDSALVSAQTRKRLYWTNIPIVGELENKDITLKDIVEPIEDKAEFNITDRMYAKKEGTLSFRKAWGSVRTLDQKSKTLTCCQSVANSGATNIKYPNGEFYKPTALESERLQTLPDNYTKYGILDGSVKEISYTQRVKCVGNGWTADVISYIFKGVK
jgi:DNA (cytosine-5)-methyltransferase 3A